LDKTAIIGIAHSFPTIFLLYGRLPPCKLGICQVLPGAAGLNGFFAFIPTLFLYPALCDQSKLSRPPPLSRLLLREAGICKSVARVGIWLAAYLIVKVHRVFPPTKLSHKTLDK